VNSEHLSHIVQQPDNITGQDALELEELCRKFPAFPTPFILLAGFYHKTGDYRAEEAIQKAALRVWNRVWLADFVQNKKLETVNEPDTSTVEEETLVKSEEKTELLPAENIVSDTIIETDTTPEILPAENQHTTEPEVEFGDAPEEITIEEIIHESEEIIAVEIATTETTDVISVTKETETGFLAVSKLFIPEDPEEWVFDEIEPLETGNEAFILGFAGAEKTKNTDKPMVGMPEITADAGGIIQPDIELESTEINTRADVFESTSFEIPATYQIEQYYPGIHPEKQENPTDFYSWLSNPAASNKEPETSTKVLEATEKNRIQQQSIIDRFIQSDPGVIRPKKEFFTPETAAKKSEHLPENLATETLAKVYLQQGNTDGAIRIYERLMLKFPEKNAYFADLIQNIKKENNP